MYKSGQTPDDVYYSPNPYEIAPPVQDSEAQRQDEYMSDQYLRMKSSNRARWSTFDDDFAYWNDPRWNNQFYFNSFYSPYSPYNPWGMGMGWTTGFGPGFYPYSGFTFGINYWTGYYNPFCPAYYGAPVVIVNRPVNPKAYAPRTGNISAYNLNRNSFITDPKTGNRVYNMSGYRSMSNSTRSGNNFYTPSSRSSRMFSRSYDEGGSYSTPSRSFGSGSSNSTRSSGSSGSMRSSGSSSSGSAPVRTFKRGG
jgi:hypothetical protein